MNLADENAKILDSILQLFQNYGMSGLDALKPVAWYICLLLIAIEFVSDWSLYEGNLRLSKVINDIIKGCFFLLIIGKWDFFVMITQDFFIRVGQLAGGGGATVVSPSDLLDRGWETCKELFQSFTESFGQAADKAYNAGVKSGADAITKGTQGTGIMSDDDAIQQGTEAMKEEAINTFKNAFNPMAILSYLIAIVMILFSYVWIALQVLLCQIEYSIFTALATIFLPFGVCKHTKFLFDRTVQGLINFGVKLMGTFFLLGVLQQGLKLMDSSVVIPAAQAFSYYLKVGIVYLCIGFLVWKLPDKFAGMMNGGGPGMSAGEVTGGAQMMYVRTRQAAGIATAPVAAVAGAAMTGLAIRNHAKFNEAQNKKDGGNRKNTFMGVLGEKIGAKVFEPYIGRRGNLDRDRSQWNSFMTGNYENLKGDVYQKP